MNFQLDYTDEELQEMSDLVYECSSEPLRAITCVANGDNERYELLYKKQLNTSFEVVARLVNDIIIAVENNYHKESIYIVYDKVSGEYVVANNDEVYWTGGYLESESGKTHKTKAEWMKINPQYEAFLEKTVVGDDE